MSYIRIARISREKGSSIRALPDLHKKMLGAILPLARMDDENLSQRVPAFLRKYQLPFEVWVVYPSDVARYLFEQGHKKECDFIVKSRWPFIWFPQDMCDVLEKKHFN